MKKKVALILTPLILFLTIFSNYQTFASSTTPIGGPSLSKFFYVEPKEYVQFNKPRQLTDEEYWKKIDAFLTTQFSQTQYEYHHVFVRRLYFENGLLVNGADGHVLMRLNISQYPGAKPSRVETVPMREGRIFFDQPNGTRVPYETLTGIENDPYWLTLEGGTSGQGVILYQNESIGDITVFSVFKKDSSYDPYKPPAYAYPGLTEPNAGQDLNNPPAGTPGPGTSVALPTRPDPPDDNWDLLGWFKYLIDWLVYVFDTFIYLLGQLGTKIGELISSSDGMVNMLKSFFNFMPDEIITLMAVGIIVSIILRIFKG